jgi:hypothetical protein
MFATFAGSGFKRVGREGRKLRQYSPIEENPYDELKGKIQDAIGKAEDN